MKLLEVKYSTTNVITRKSSSTEFKGVRKMTKLRGG